MPIRFKVEDAGGYFVVEVSGKISDEEMADSYKAFYGGSWRPGLNELVNIGDGDMTGITRRGVENLAQLVEQHFERHGIDSARTAIYAPGTLPFGLARMYEMMAEESPESVRVFKDLGQATAWVKREG